MRVGNGFDAHRLVSGRLLILGGVTIPYHLGLEGHSDADVLCHAVMDAILGALGEGDIGRHFPDSDPAYKGIESLRLLRQVADLAGAKGYTVSNLDAVVIAQEPRLSPHFPAMRRLLAGALGVLEERINLKATTTEGMGFTGRGEGMAAMAVVLLDRAVDR